MNELVNLAIDAQGGLDRWRKFQTVTAHLLVGGVLWEMKGHGDAIEQVDVKVNLLEQKTSHIPSPAWHTLYTPDRVAIETGSDTLVDELYNPRSSFKEHTWETKWSNLQLAYFTGYATWNYVNTPFQFTRPGFDLREIETWEENNETWRRLVVNWPKDIHTHSQEQVFYIDKEGLIRRLDYKVEVAGNVPVVHYLSDYRDVSGIKMATKRVVYLLGKDNQPQVDAPVLVSIEFKDIQLA
jgi:hypothetical protein